jgi:hypothetical protein
MNKRAVTWAAVLVSLSILSNWLFPTTNPDAIGRAAANPIISFVGYCIGLGALGGIIYWIVAKFFPGRERIISAQTTESNIQAPHDSGVRTDENRKHTNKSRVFYKLYLSLLIFFVGLAGVLFISYFVVDLHDYLVVGSDFECIDHLSQKLWREGDVITVPFDRMSDDGKDPIDPNAYSVEKVGQLPKCNIFYAEWEKNYVSNRAWSSGLRTSNFFSRGITFLWLGMISATGAILTLLIRKWVVWLSS